eukprot:4359102-Pyramimonas_sp.AAC.1
MSEWKELSGSHAQLKKAYTKYGNMLKPDKHATFLKDLEAFTDALGSLIKQGRSTIAEAMIIQKMKDHGPESPETRDMLIKQKRELLKVESPHTLLHARLFEAMQVASKSGQGA